MEKRNLLLICLMIAAGQINCMDNDGLIRIAKKQKTGAEKYVDSSSSDDSSSTDEFCENKQQDQKKELIKQAFQAIENRDLEKFAGFFKTKISLNAVNEDGETLLGRAIENRSKQLVSLLLLFGADVNQKTGTFGIPPLNAAIMNDEEIAHIMLNRDDINIKLTSEDGKNGLHVAVQFNRSKSLIKKLIQKDVDINVQDNVGQTPLNIAQGEFRPNPEAAEILKQYGAIKNKNYKPVLVPQNNPYIQANMHFLAIEK